jgi:carbonic anhydrase/acetyltransferase-like protein (isoleucine patch superfamily)
MGAPDATLIGRVELDPEVSFRPQAVLRGDSGDFRASARTSIQDGTVAGPRSSGGLAGTRHPHGPPPR